MIAHVAIVIDSNPRVDNHVRSDAAPSLDDTPSHDDASSADVSGRRYDSRRVNGRKGSQAASTCSCKNPLADNRSSANRPDPDNEVVRPALLRETLEISVGTKDRDAENVAITAETYETNERNLTTTREQ